MKLPAGTAHTTIAADIRDSILRDKKAISAWLDITPLARNEWICWVEDAKQPATRARRAKRVRTELAEGIRRPCCWIGCTHRKDKEISPSIKWVLSRKKTNK